MILLNQKSHHIICLLKTLQMVSYFAQRKSQSTHWSLRPSPDSSPLHNMWDLAPHRLPSHSLQPRWPPSILGTRQAGSYPRDSALLPGTLFYQRPNGSCSSLCSNERCCAVGNGAPSATSMLSCSLIPFVAHTALFTIRHVVYLLAMVSPRLDTLWGQELAFVSRSLSSSWNRA